MIRINYILIMSLEFRQHQQTLNLSQRFYYNNYEYYNDFQNLQDYKNDLSKLRFNLYRKSTTTIILYDTLSSNYDQPAEREIKHVSPQYTPHNQFININNKSLDDYFYHFMSTFHEQNYSQMKIERIGNPKQYQVNILYFLLHGLSKEFQQSQNQDFEQLIQILKKLKEIGEESRQSIQALFQRQNRIQSPQFMERWFAFELYFDFFLSKKLLSQQNNIEKFYLNQFSQYFKWILNQIFEGNYKSIFLMAIPYQPMSSLILHPLTIPLNFVLKKQSKEKKIIFLNLDGKQTCFNLRAIKNLPASVRYISIFNQPQGSQIKSQKLQKTCSEFEVDSNYDNLNFAHSQLIFRQARPRDVEGALTPPNQNILLYPLNSIYLRRSFAQINKGKTREERTLPVMNNSADIRWLWEERISGQVQQWCPELIIVSYNGHLHLNQEDFQAIMKDLTIFSDHKVILFPNMSGLIKNTELTFEAENDEELPLQKIEVINQFMQKYNEYKYEKINEEIFFDNLSSFIKISSGNVSLRPIFKNQNISKYCLGNRLKYLQRLSQLQLYSDVISPPYKQTVELQKLFEQFSQRQKKQNRKQNQFWENMLDEIEKQLLKKLQQGLEEENRYNMEVQTNSNDLQIQFRLNELALEVEVEFQRIFQQQLSVYNEVAEIIQRNKEKIILTNLQHYRYRKSYLSDQQERGGRIRCLRFSFGDEEQIYLERYSQVITDQRKQKVFVINYREGEQNYVILQGQLNDRGAATVKLQKANIRLEQSFQDLNLQNRSEIIRINYSHCFIRQKLYLYWPQEWDLKQEIRRKLLGLTYHPPHVNYMLRVQYHPQQRSYLIDHLKWVGPNNSIPIIPRKSCTSHQKPGSQTTFFILGGIYDSRLDYYSNDNPVNTCVVSQDSFTITTEPKRKDRVIYKQNNLKPKMNYKIEKNTKNQDQSGSSLMITKGYGRSFTNYHSLMSYQSYSLSFQLQGVKTCKISSKNYRAVRLEKPLTIENVGRYLIGQPGQTEERFSQNTKDFIIAESRHEKNGEKQILTVVQDEIRIFDFKNNHKRQYLFGWDRTIRQKIYIPHCWSPQLQIVVGGRMHFVYTSLRTEKSGNFNIGNYLIPKQEDIVSMCLQEDRLLLLANSPILNHLDNRPNNYILYQGSLANMSDLLKRKQLPLHDRFEFKNATSSLRWKGLFSLDQKIYLLGGLGRNQQNGAYTREDYVLQSAKDKLKLKTKRIECLTSSLDLISPILVKYKENYLLYALASEQRRISKGEEGQAVVQDFWRIKIQTLSTNDSASQQTLYTQPLQIYHYDTQKKEATLRRTPLDEPKLVKIVQYTKFSASLLRQYLQKVYIKVNKFEQEKYEPYLQIIAEILKVREEQKINQLLIQHHHHSPFFKKLLMEFDFLLDEQKRQKQNIQNEELTRDLRSLYSLLNKHLLEKILLSENTDCEYYRFIMEDRASRKVKYIAISPLSSTKLKFLRVRYKHQLSICLNQKKEQELFYNTNVLACQEITQERVRGSSLDLQEEGAQHKININYKS